MKGEEQTKRKLIDAVAVIFRTEGYTGLGVNKVVKIADVHKKVIYRYFGGFEQLAEAYIVETDYWMKFADHMPTASRLLRIKNAFFAVVV
jgi:AcrR family transcriptional regulator